jgi:PKD repeat protein
MTRPGACVLAILLATACGDDAATAVPDGGSDGTDAGGLALTFPIVDTAQALCYDDSASITCPAAGAPFAGQDAQHVRFAPRYLSSADGLTVTDAVTGLTWQRSPDTTADGVLDAADKLTWAEAQARPAALNAARYGGYDDWRLPTIKEQYSLIRFDGTDPSAAGTDTSALIPFIDDTAFGFAYGDTGAGERIIDSQYASSTLYVAPTTDGGKLFGVNFADGRIKGYGLVLGGGDKTFFVQCVRGNPAYGRNDLIDDGDGTITDRATGLAWSQEDSGEGLDWEAALAWVAARNAEAYLGHDDWRLPDAKELHSIVDYGRSPDTTSSAAIDPLFHCTELTGESGDTDYPWYWTGTTHASSNGSAAAGAYVAFGRAMGYMNGGWVDIHGAGSQRSDPKAGDSLASYTQSGDGTYNPQAPQGDAIRIFNYVRLVRDVPGYLPLEAWFSYAPAQPVKESPVVFADASRGEAVSWAWSFGDGGTASEAGPSHIFAAAGTYAVTLTVAGPAGTSTVTRELEVLAAAPAPTASFTSSATDLSVSFTDTSSGTPASWTWGFGDGATASAQSPSHTYAAAGTYPVTLTVSNAAGSSTATHDVTVTEATGPTSCETEADCAEPGACPPDAALGCGCEVTPTGASACIPLCETSDDCPSPPGVTLTCSADGICVPG